MRRGVLSLLAIVLAIPVLYGSIRQSYSFETAALRLVVLAVGVSIIDRYLGPLMTAFLKMLDGPGAERGPSRE